MGFVKEIAKLFKLRLSFLVVFSACLGYLFADSQAQFLDILLLSIGGFLVTGASNGFNQILEKKQDGLMNRTKERPIPSGRLSSLGALWVSIISGIIGLSCLYFQFDLLPFLLGLFALLSYAFIYTPLKPITPFAVFVGAFPGAIPPMLGYVAASGVFDLSSGLLFVSQFIWQFPHFWAIAWVLDEDYSKGGFKLLPSAGGRNESSAFQILMYALFTIPMGILPWVFNLTGIVSLWVVVAAGLPMVYFSIKLYNTLDVKFAKKLMFSSFIYLPVIQIIYVLDKI